MNTAILIRLFPTTSNEELARVLGATKGAVAAKAFRLGLKKDEKYLSSINQSNAYKRYR